MTDNHDPKRIEQKQARLTAYALGQLDESERAAVEVELAASPEAHAFVDEIRALADHVQEAARREPLPPPSPALRDKLGTRLDQLEDRPMTADDVQSLAAKKTDARRRNWGTWVAAACLLLLAAGSLALVAPNWFLARHRNSREVVSKEPARSRDFEYTEGLPNATSPAGYRKIPAGRFATDRGDGDAPLHFGGDKGDGSLLAEFEAEAGTGDFLTEVEDRKQIQTEILQAEVETGISQARSRRDLDLLREQIERAADVGPQTRARLREKVVAATEKTPADHSDLASLVGEGDGIYRRSRSPSPHTMYVVEPQIVATNDQTLAKRPATGAELFRNDPFDAQGRPRSENLPDDSTPGTETYDKIYENDFHMVSDKPRSTLSIDVDTASYANVRRFLNTGRLPPPDAVRIEEMVNYFKYDYPQPDDETPFAVHMEVTECPWRTGNRLLKVGLKGREIDREQRGLSNLVFLLDVSGSMASDNKLPLVKQAMRLLVEQLTEDDRVAIVTYASNAGLHLESTCGEDKKVILQAIDGLHSGGSTHGSAGIQLAYEQATRHFVPDGINRVILCTDGDLNVGITRDDDLVRFIEDKANTGVFLTVLGFGTGNLKDSKMEKLADKGNGTYAYIDTLREGRKVLVEQMTGSLVTIAKDVKIQIEFNPAEVMAYRLIGYENRVLAARDFHDDSKDAGEIGAGHTVTALYELVPEGSELPAAGETPLKYQRVPEGNLTDAAGSGELLTLRLRYKQPDAEQSELLREFTLKDEGLRFGRSSPDFQFAAAVASFGMLLRGSKYAGDATLAAVEEYATSGLGDDPQGYRAEFVDLVRRARQLSPR